MPIVQLIVLVSAATLEMKHIKTCIIDNDNTSMSRELKAKFKASPFFIVVGETFDQEQALSELKRDNVDMIMNIPLHFEKDMYSENNTDIQLLINAINGTAAGLINAYSNAVISDFSAGLLSSDLHLMPEKPVSLIDIKSSFWYNPELNYQIYMLPGILVILVTVVGMFLTALNLVREKETGTTEQINVSPVKKYQFITGKLIPFWIIALLELAFGLFIGVLLFDLPIVGHLWVLFAFAAIYLFVALGIGLFLSTVSATQQQTMFLSFFFMLVFVLMSGIFTPTESMPEVAKWANYLNPMAYFMRVIRMVLLKGSGFIDIAKEALLLGIYACLIFIMAVKNYKKVA